MCALSVVILVNIPVEQLPVPRWLFVKFVAANMEFWILTGIRQRIHGQRKRINIIINVFMAVIPIWMKQTAPVEQLPVLRMQSVPCVAIHMVNCGHII